MEVIEVKPYGYCSGVLLALRKALEAKRLRPDKSVYLLGMLVHNEDSVASLKKEGLLLLDERNEDLKSQLEKAEEGATVIFSAHGHPRVYDEIAHRKSIETIDCACPFVTQNEEEAHQKIATGEEIIYLGVKGHLESEAFRQNVEEAAFFDVHSFDFEKEKISVEDPLLLCQTTLSEDEIELAVSELLPTYPRLKRGKLRCASTSLRQAAIKALPQDVEAVLVLGSNTSNNSLKLLETAHKMGFPSFLARNLEQVKSLPLGQYRKLALASGASTSVETYAEVKAYCETL